MQMLTCPKCNNTERFARVDLVDYYAVGVIGLSDDGDPHGAIMCKECYYQADLEHFDGTLLRHISIYMTTLFDKTPDETLQSELEKVLGPVAIIALKEAHNLYNGTEHYKVVISVDGGVASVESAHPCVEVEIQDGDGDTAICGKCCYYEGCKEEGATYEQEACDDFDNPNAPMALESA